MKKEKYNPGDKVKLISNPSGATMAKVGNIYTLKSKVDNGKYAPEDKKKKLWTTEELGFWAISEFNIEKVQ